MYKSWHAKECKSSVNCVTCITGENCAVGTLHYNDILRKANILGNCILCANR